MLSLLHVVRHYICAYRVRANCKRLVALAVLALAFSSPPARGADTNQVTAELNQLVTRINAKLVQGKRTEADLAENLKEFDALLARHKDEKTDQTAQILLMRAQLYEEVLDDPEKCLESLAQLKRDFPETKLGKATDQMIEGLKPRVAAKKIQRTLVQGAKFPDLEEKDLNGKPLSLSAYKGKVVLVDFWATWCPPCVAELPGILNVYKRHHANGFEIIGVSLDQDEQRLKSFSAQQGLVWQQFFDGKAFDNKLALRYGIQRTPTSYLLDGEGRILAKDLRGDTLEQAVASATQTPAPGIKPVDSALTPTPATKAPAGSR